MGERLAAGRTDQGMALWGLRGVGKTVLLNDMARHAAAQSWGMGYVELGSRGPLRPALATIAAQVAQSLARQPGIAERARAALRVVSSFSITAMPAGLTFSFDVEPHRGRGDSGQLDVDLYEVLLELGDVAREAGAGVALFFDEMQRSERCVGRSCREGGGRVRTRCARIPSRSNWPLPLLHSDLWQVRVGSRSAVADRYGCRAGGELVTQQQTAVQRQNLIDVKGLLYSPQRGLIDFTAPLFGDYVRRHHPLADFV